MSKPELALHAKEDGTGRAYRYPYLLPGEDTVRSYPSVTTILKLVDKSGLVNWAVGLTLEWASQNWHLLGQRADEDVLKLGRYRWTDVRDERAEVGTGIHETIEAEHTNSWNYPPLDDEQREIMAQWRALQQRFTITPVLSEFTVFNHTVGYAGTADGLWIITDNLTGETKCFVVDIKTSRNTWPEHWMQLSALRCGDNEILTKLDLSAVRSKGTNGVYPDGSWLVRSYADLEAMVGMTIEPNPLVIHLRSDLAEIKTVTPFETSERFNQFKSYTNVWYAEQSIKTAAKAASNKF